MYTLKEMSEIKSDEGKKLSDRLLLKFPISSREILANKFDLFGFNCLKSLNVVINRIYKRSYNEGIYSSLHYYYSDDVVFKDSIILSKSNYLYCTFNPKRKFDRARTLKESQYIINCKYV